MQQQQSQQRQRLLSPRWGMSVLVALVALMVLGGCEEGGEELAPLPPPATPRTVESDALAPGEHARHSDSVVPDLTPITGGRVFFSEPQDNAVVTSPVRVVMEAVGATVQAAGDLEQNTGHHHIIIDGGGEAMGAVVPADETHIHFGKGETEAMLELAPGQHTLTLQLADGMHRSYGPVMSSTISIVVRDAGP